MSAVTVGFVPQTGQSASLRQLQLAEAHPQRVVDQEAADQRLADRPGST